MQCIMVLHADLGGLLKARRGKAVEKAKKKTEWSEQGRSASKKETNALLFAIASKSFKMHSLLIY